MIKILFLLLSLIYVVIGLLSIYQSYKFLNIARYIYGTLLLTLSVFIPLNTTSIDSIWLFIITLCLVMNIEITAFKDHHGDRKRLFLLHWFTAFIILIIVLILFIF
ncbi:hypothetical protein [Abyssicoccus albus]|uniref:DUF1516 family protein n=1 Tax=Abyssicoccus albus TaxID=1817405 RepID=A0A3N5BGE7_9BACL|nr:hypothetical protein [Abyssicoccus albus]RPF56597.1 hypothetical protein EDD62_1248 [Abyssicoccus albus]